MKREDNPMRERYELAGICPVCNSDVRTCGCPEELIHEVLEEMEDES